MKVFVRYNWMSSSYISIQEVERETKTLYILKDGARYRKETPSKYSSAIGRYERHCIYPITDKNLINQHITQIFKELENEITFKILDNLKYLNYPELNKILEIVKR